jgi:hypothetical protein
MVLALLGSGAVEVDGPDAAADAVGGLEDLPVVDADGVEEELAWSV